MLRRALVIVAAVVVASLIGLWLCDGPAWGWTLPPTVPAAIRADVARLHSWRGSTRADACRKLATGGAAAAPFLVEHMDDTGSADGIWAGVRRGFSFHGGPNPVMVPCIQALEAMGRDAVPALITGLNTNPRELVRHASAELLGETHDPSALPHLQLALFDASNDVRNIVVDSLAAFCDPKVVKWTRSLLHEDDKWQRAAAVRRLGKCDSPDVTPDLEEALKDPEPAVVKEAEVALSRRRVR
jgi:hypothetical protein